MLSVLNKSKHVKLWPLIHTQAHPHRSLTSINYEVISKIVVCLIMICDFLSTSSTVCSLSLMSSSRGIIVQTVYVHLRPTIWRPFDDVLQISSQRFYKKSPNQHVSFILIDHRLHLTSDIYLLYLFVKMLELHI